MMAISPALGDCPIAQQHKVIGEVNKKFFFLKEMWHRCRFVKQFVMHTGQDGHIA